METNSLMLLVYCVAGGVVVALLLIRLPRWSIAKAPQVHSGGHVSEISIDMINMAHIRVAGVGGLGLVVMCALVAIVIPPIGLSLGAGSVLGTVLAIIWIVRRSKAGPIPTSSQTPGANATLMIDAAEPPEK